MAVCHKQFMIGPATEAKETQSKHAALSCTCLQHWAIAIAKPAGQTSDTQEPSCARESAESACNHVMLPFRQSDQEMRPANNDHWVIFVMIPMGQTSKAQITRYVRESVELNRNHVMLPFRQSGQKMKPANNDHWVTFVMIPIGQ